MTDEPAPEGDAAKLPAYLAGDAGPTSNEEATVTGVDTDHLQAAE